MLSTAGRVLHVLCLLPFLYHEQIERTRISSTMDRRFSNHFKSPPTLSSSPLSALLANVPVELLLIILEHLHSASHRRTLANLQTPVSYFGRRDTGP